ncbi:hypothetical protein Hanom_Chr03g00253321 [Helianthus anomalus]
MLFVLESRVSQVVASLFLGIEARYVYISPSPDPISSFAICGIHWELGVSLEAASLSTGIEVRFAYIPPSPDPTYSLAIGGIILGTVVVVVVYTCKIAYIPWYFEIIYMQKNEIFF